MKERPILFSSEMVRAILEGRKTQTRRVAKIDWKSLDTDNSIDMQKAIRQCPFGQPGDRLWVRETWKLESFMEGEPMSFQYKADGAILEENGRGEFAPNFDSWYENICWKSQKILEKLNWPINENGMFEWEMGHSPLPWQPSIFMPRWASRIDIENVSVRVERLQEITDDHAIQEGVDRTNSSIVGFPRTRFQKLWDSLNSKLGYGWDQNPLVWVIEFKRIE